MVASVASQKTIFDMEEKYYPLSLHMIIVSEVPTSGSLRLPMYRTRRYIELRMLGALALRKHADLRNKPRGAYDGGTWVQILNAEGDYLNTTPTPSAHPRTPSQSKAAYREDGDENCVPEVTLS